MRKRVNTSSPYKQCALQTRADEKESKQSSHYRQCALEVRADEKESKTLQAHTRQWPNPGCLLTANRFC